MKIWRMLLLLLGVVGVAAGCGAEDRREQAVQAPAEKAAPILAEKIATISQAEIAVASSGASFAPVAAVLVPHCAPCHSPNGRMGPPPEGFIATSYTTLLESGERAWIVPGQPLASELYRRIKGYSLPRMPFDGPPFLSDAEVELVGEWIAAGAPDDSGRPAPLPVGARVRLGGTLSDPWHLDGLPLTVGPETRIDGTMTPGQRLEVRGRIGADGTIAVERVRGR